MTAMGEMQSQAKRVITHPLTIATGASLFGWLVVIAAVWLGTRQFVTLEQLGRADGVHYLAIATTGYEFFQCSDDYWPGGWCGNAAWQPLYPMLIRLGVAIGLPAAVAGIAITAVAGFAFIWLMIRDSGRTGQAAWQLALILAVAPGTVWLHAIFPMTLLLLTSALAFRAARNGRSFAAGMWCSLAILSHSSGFFVALAVGVFVAVGSKPWLHAMTVLLLPIVAVAVIWLASLQVLVGDWRAWWLVQQKYYAESGSAFEKARSFVHHLGDAFSALATQAQVWSSVQSWIVVAFVMAGIVASIRAAGSRQDRLANLLQVVILGVFPFAVGGLLSISRNQAQTSLFIPRTRIGVWAEWLMIGLLTIVGAQITQMFVLGLVD